MRVLQYLEDFCIETFIQIHSFNNAKNPLHWLMYTLYLELYSSCHLLHDLKVHCYNYHFSTSNQRINPMGFLYMTVSDYSISVRTSMPVYRVFPSGGTPHGLYPPKIKLKNCPPPSLLIMTKIFLDIFFDLCMTKANLTIISSLRVQLYCLIEILKQQQLKSLKQDQWGYNHMMQFISPILLHWCCVIVRVWKW